MPRLALPSHANPLRHHSRRMIMIYDNHSLPRLAEPCLAQPRLAPPCQALPRLAMPSRAMPYPAMPGLVIR